MPLDDPSSLYLVAHRHSYRETVRFYETGLGLRRLPGQAGAAIFDLGGQRLVLLKTDKNSSNRETGLRLHVHGLMHCLSYLKKAGFSGVPSDFALGSKNYVEIEDPSGNVITLADSSRIL